MNQKFELQVAQKKFELNFYGNQSLLSYPKISIVGSRKCSQYTRLITAKLASLLTKNGVKIVSGGAIGVDIIAHQNAGANNCICVLPSGLNEPYPSINKNFLEQIGQHGLLVSQFENDFKATNWSFVLRNEIVIWLGDALVVTEAELKSGSMKSIEFALKHNKKIYVPTHRIDESSATNYLLKNNLATAIYDIQEFVNEFCQIKSNSEEVHDEFLEFCKHNPNYEDVFRFDSSKLFEYELLGKIKIENAKVAIL